MWLNPTITRQGRFVHVSHSLSSARHRLTVPSSCPQSDSAIWARSGAVVVPRSGNLLVATGNAPFDGSRYWGDSVLMLTPNASQLLHSWTPRNQAQLNGGDVDLGSTAPAVLGPSLAAQSGKDGIIRLLRLPVLGGRLGHLGGELQTIQAPGGSGVFSTMAVSHAGGTARMFVGNGAGVWGYVLSGGRGRSAGGRGGGRNEPGAGRRAAVRLRPERGPERLQPQHGRRRRPPSGRRRPLGEPDRHRRPDRARRGRRKLAQHLGRARYLALAGSAALDLRA